MSEQACPRESESVAALRRGPLDAPLREHVLECEACSETLAVATALRESSDADSAPLPSAGLVWWKAQMRMRREMAERATRPIEWVQRASAVAVLAGSLWGLFELGSSSPGLMAAAVGGIAALVIAGGSALALAARSRK
jgi:ferric-dicitrate binding protein FerR (iron transport regulator)